MIQCVNQWSTEYIAAAARGDIESMLLCGEYSLQHNGYGVIKHNESDGMRYLSLASRYGSSDAIKLYKLYYKQSPVLNYHNSSSTNTDSLTTSSELTELDDLLDSTSINTPMSSTPKPNTINTIDKQSQYNVKRSESHPVLLKTVVSPVIKQSNKIKLGSGARCARNTLTRHDTGFSWIINLFTSNNNTVCNEKRISTQHPVHAT